MKKLVMRFNFIATIIALVVFFLLQISTLDLMASENPKTIYVVISDSDDTIAVSHIVPRSPLGNITKGGHALNPSDAFIGAAELYCNLAKKGVQFEYVSGMPKILNYILPGGLTPFLKRNQFPFPVNIHLKPSIFDKTYDFKVKEIEEIIKKYEGQSAYLVLLLVGDNGEQDISVYKHIKESLLNRAKDKTEVTVGAIFIHKLYSGEHVLKLEPEQIPYITFADLALQIQAKYPNLLTKDESTEILELVKCGLSSDETSLNSSRNLTLPHWAKITDPDLDEMDKIFDKATQIDKGLRECVKTLIRMRVRYIRSLSSPKDENQIVGEEIRGSCFPGNPSVCRGSLPRKPRSQNTNHQCGVFE